MSEYGAAAQEIVSLLGLESPPVALAFVDARPEGVVQTSEVSPATCGFWRQAERGVFYADAAQHFNCQVGAMVMGFDLPEQVMQEIGGLVESMCGCSYLSPDEGDKIPSMGGSAHGGAAGVLYGPLADFPAAADSVVLWLTPKQAMLFNEVAGGSSWAAQPSRVSGRPACAALPLSIQGERPALSFGCIGMRTFTDIADDRMLAVVPAAKLPEFVDGLRETANANQAMLAYYQQRKAAITG
jgi:uncharacterized protein (DUF169 family)